MVNAVMTLNVATNFLARDGGALLRSPTSPGSASCPTTSEFYGQTVTFSPREATKSGSPAAGVRAYAQEAVAKNHYAVLGVSKKATPREIKAAYRMAARRLHPDVVPEERRLEATKAFLEMQETYSILSDHRARAAYDLSESMRSFQAAGFSNRGPVSYGGREEIAFSTPSWGFSTVNCSSPSYSSSSFSCKGQNWETDQCW